MELKQFIKQVPVGFKTPFNRTYLELKLMGKMEAGSTAKAFNRTYLELKPCRLSGSAFARYSFNRTYLELKPPLPRQLIFPRWLLIAPIWN